MHKVRELLRLKYGVGLSIRKIADSLQIARSSVGEYLRRFSESGLAWPLPDGLSDADLERQLFPPATKVPAELRSLHLTKRGSCSLTIPTYLDASSGSLNTNGLFNRLYRIF